jgi:hypothetical protein
MRPTFKKLEVKDIGSLERLVAENVEGIEPGLKIVDSRLLLGQAAIDLVGLDAKGSLTLIALDFSADEGLLLRVMDAYSWCLEYPDTLRRLYPMAQLSTSRPPRILFIVERLTDSFLRRIKQLSFLEIDCLEFRHLEVNGASVVYFDHVERLRKPVVDSSVETPAPISITPAVIAAVEPHVEPVKRPVTEPPVTRAVVAEPTRFEAPVPHAPSAQPPLAAPAAVVMPTPPAVPEYQSVTLATESPVMVSPSLVAAVAEPAVDEPVLASPTLQLEAIEATVSLPSVDSGTNGHATEPVAAIDQPWVEPEVDAAVVAATPEVAEPVQAPVAEAVPVAAPAEPVTPIEPAPISAAPVPTPPVWAKLQGQPAGSRPYFFAQATKGIAPVEAPAATVAAPAEQPAATAQPSVGKAAVAVDDRPELESLSFPKDGLSRQWLEFLSQLGATK